MSSSEYKDFRARIVSCTAYGSWCVCVLFVGLEALLYVIRAINRKNVESVVSKKFFLWNSGLPVKAAFVAAPTFAFALSQQAPAALQPAEFCHTMCNLVFSFSSVDLQIIKTRRKRDFRGSFCQHLGQVQLRHKFLLINIYWTCFKKQL